MKSKLSDFSQYILLQEGQDLTNNQCDTKNLGLSASRVSELRQRMVGVYAGFFRLGYGAAMVT